jgi:predicted MFS family arabinose efflux permease
MVSSMLWGAYFGLYTGTYDAIIYDTLAEEGHDGELFDRTYGWVRISESIGLVIGSLAGGVIASVWGLRAPYWATVPVALLAIGALAIFREPTLHKAKEAVGIMHQIRQTLRSVLRNRDLRPVALIMITATLLEFTMFEFDQLWLIALAAPVAWFGPVNALFLALLGVGGAVTASTRNRPWSLRLLLGIMVAGALVLVWSRLLWLTIAAETLVILGAIAMGILLTKDMHDHLPSEVRAGASSAISTISRVALMVTALIFGAVTQTYSIYVASWIIVALAVPTAALSWRRAQPRR